MNGFIALEPISEWPWAGLVQPSPVLALRHPEGVRRHSASQRSCSCASTTAGPRAAVLFTILAGAKHHRLEPWAYLRDVLLRMAAGETDLESLLPDRWGANHPEHVLQHRLDESRRKAIRQKEARQRRRAAGGRARRGAPGRGAGGASKPERGLRFPVSSLTEGILRHRERDDAAPDCGSAGRRGAAAPDTNRRVDSIVTEETRQTGY